MRASGRHPDGPRWYDQSCRTCARGWGKCCIVGCGALHIDALTKTMTVGGKAYHEGDWFTLNGTRGYVYAGKLAMVSSTHNRGSSIS